VPRLKACQQRYQRFAGAGGPRKQTLARKPDQWCLFGAAGHDPMRLSGLRSFVTKPGDPRRAAPLVMGDGPRDPGLLDIPTRLGKNMGALPDTEAISLVWAAEVRCREPESRTFVGPVIYIPVKTGDQKELIDAVKCTTVRRLGARAEGPRRRDAKV
jgi:hypothetical protein